MAFENSIKGFIIPSNLEEYSNYYKEHHLCKYKKLKHNLKFKLN